MTILPHLTVPIWIGRFQIHTLASDPGPDRPDPDPCPAADPRPIRPDPDPQLCCTGNRRLLIHILHILKNYSNHINI